MGPAQWDIGTTLTVGNKLYTLKKSKIAVRSKKDYNISQSSTMHIESSQYVWQ